MRSLLMEVPSILFALFRCCPPVIWHFSQLRRRTLPSPRAASDRRCQSASGARVPALLAGLRRPLRSRQNSHELTGTSPAVTAALQTPTRARHSPYFKHKYRKVRRRESKQVSKAKSPSHGERWVSADGRHPQTPSALCRAAGADASSETICNRQHPQLEVPIFFFFF